jgi:hypothetical protein
MYILQILHELIHRIYYHWLGGWPLINGKIVTLVQELKTVINYVDRSEMIPS